MHLNRLDLSCQVVGGEGDNISGLQDAGLDTANRHSSNTCRNTELIVFQNTSNTSDLVDVLQGKPERLVIWSFWGLQVIKSANQSVSLVPRHVVGCFDHVVASPTRDGGRRLFKTAALVGMKGTFSGL